MLGVASKQVSNLDARQGDYLVNQGEVPETLILLNQGRVSLQLKLPPEHSTENVEKKICSLGSPAIVGVSALLLKRPYPYSIVASSPLVLSSVTSNEDTLLKFFTSKPNMVPLLLRSILKETMDTLSKMNMICTVSINLAQYITSMSIAYFKINPEAMGKTKKIKDDKVLFFALKAHETFQKKNDEAVPDEITMEFLKRDYLAPEQHQAHLHMNFDQNELNYYRRFISLPPQILGAIATRDPKFILLTAKKISDISFSLIKGLIESNQYLEAKIDLLFNHDYGWIKKIESLLATSHDPKKMGSLENIGNLLINLVDMTEKQLGSIWEGNNLVNQIDNQKITKIKEFLASYHSEKALSTSTQNRIQVNPKALEETKGMSHKIFGYAGLSSKLPEYNTMMDKLKRSKNPMDMNDDVRKLRRGINNLFWELYETAAVKHLNNNDVLPKHMQMFFDFSVLEESLLESYQLTFLYEATTKTYSGPYSFQTPIEWLRKIYAREITTSINELGLTFFEIIRQNNRDKPWKRESDLPPKENSPEARVKFEIQNMLSSNAKLTSGSVITYLAPLSKFQINQPLDRSFLDKQKLSEALDKLLDVDFSCFHREIFFEKQEMGILREFVQLRVVPYFIMTPSAGNVFQHWQEREEKNKMSPGRICVPSIATDSVYKLLLTVAGAYRWEMTKTIMGPDWNNISQSSITADYTDYVQFFKKNRDLSPEMKEKLSQEFRRFRDDRSRFMHDYFIWIKFESNGTQRLNKVSRKIMAKHVPFRKPYREKLLQLPSYTDLINKNINIRRRKAKEMEPRLKKYRQMNNNEIPKELLDTFDYFNMEY